MAYSSTAIPAWIVVGSSKQEVPAGPVPRRWRDQTFDWIGVKDLSDVAGLAAGAECSVVPPRGDTGSFPSFWRLLRDAGVAPIVKMTIVDDIQTALLIPLDVYVFALVGVRHDRPAPLPTFANMTPAGIRISYQEGLELEERAAGSPDVDGVLINAKLAFLTRMLRNDRARRIEASRTPTESDAPKPPSAR